VLNFSPSQYHQSGRECWLNSKGKPRPSKRDAFNPHWAAFLSYDFEYRDPEGKIPSLCRYLSDPQVPELDGMRAYIDYVFNYFYHDIFRRWSLSLIYPKVVAERTKVVCFEDLVSMSPAQISSSSNGTTQHMTTSDIAVQGMLEFLFKGPVLPIPFNGTDPSEVENTHGHGTSHDPALRDHLTEIVKQIDATFYDGDIAWLSSIWPCSEKQLA